MASHVSSKEEEEAAVEAAATSKTATEDAAGSRKRIVSIVFTGGPCGGKSTAMTQLGTLLRERMSDVDLYTVPETPTILFSNGARYPGHESPSLLAFEKAVVDMTIHVHDAFLAVAKSTNKRSVLLVDRGVMDIGAYCDGEIFERVKASAGVNDASMLDRYDAVIHLQSAAIGAREFYTTANNAARTEDMDVSAELDEKTYEVWSQIRHPCHFKVENKSGASFAEKMLEVEALVLQLLSRLLVEEEQPV